MEALEDRCKCGSSSQLSSLVGPPSLHALQFVPETGRQANEQGISAKSSLDSTRLAASRKYIPVAKPIVLGWVSFPPRIA